MVVEETALPTSTAEVSEQSLGAMVLPNCVHWPLVS